MRKTMDWSKKLPGIAGIGGFFHENRSEWGSFAVQKSEFTAVRVKKSPKSKDFGEQHRYK